MIIRVFLDRLLTLHKEKYYYKHKYCNLCRLYNTNNSSIEAPSTYYLRGIDGDRDVTGSYITGNDVTGSCITGYDVTGSREPEMKGR